jgi:hypothetical protein
LSPANCHHRAEAAVLMRSLRVPRGAFSWAANHHDLLEIKLTD